eukprot:scaffold54272_cov66-Phaeocystis_antarctica.AAC.4
MPVVAAACLVVGTVLPPPAAGWSACDSRSVGSRVVVVPEPLVDCAYPRLLTRPKVMLDRVSTVRSEAGGVVPGKQHEDQEALVE